MADLTQIWRIRAQAGAAGAANGWSSAAPIGTQGVMFAASTAGYGSVTVSFDWYATTQREAKLQQYTTDGSTWKNVQLTAAGIAANTVPGPDGINPCECDFNGLWIAGGE